MFHGTMHHRLSARLDLFLLHHQSHLPREKLSYVLHSGILYIKLPDNRLSHHRHPNIDSLNRKDSFGKGETFMKAKKVFGIVLSSAMILSLAVAVNTSALDTQSVSRAPAGEIHVQGPGLYEFGDGVRLKIEPIPAGLLAFDETIRNIVGEFFTDSTEINRQDTSDFTTAEVQVDDGGGKYDLGKGGKLGIEKIPGDLEYGSITRRP